MNFANNLEDLANEIGKWKGMTNGIVQKDYMDSLINRAFEIVEPKFNMAAALSADDFDFAHMYEYGTRNVGKYTGEDGSLDPMSPNNRLWESVLIGGGGRKEIAFVFLPANQPNPPKTPENTGGADADFDLLQVNQGEEYIWYQKAETVELNKSVFIKVQSAKALFIPINQGVSRVTEKERDRGYAFRKSTVSRPGQWTGGAGQFTAFFAGWWAEQGGVEMETAMMEQFNEDVADFNRKNPPQKSRPKPAGSVNINGTAETADRKYRKQWEIYTKQGERRWKVA